MADGFTLILVADSAGYTFTLTDIVDTDDASITTRSYTNTFAGTEFINNFGTGHIYYTRQGSTGTAAVNISELSIDVIPEPLTTTLLGFLTLGCVFNRRRPR